MSILEEIPGFAPLHFLECSATAYYSKQVPSVKEFLKDFQLPDTSLLLGEEAFAKVSMAWNEEALMIHVTSEKAFEESSYPDFEKGDSIELFVDTRDLKTAGFPTKFCHHLVILPKEVQEVQVQEVTHFRAEDTRDYIDTSSISVETKFKSTGYEMTVLIPAGVLFGFDPISFKKLGFTYKINRTKGKPQHLFLSSEFCKIQKHPSLWGSIEFIRDSK